MNWLAGKTPEQIEQEKWAAKWDPDTFGATPEAVAARQAAESAFKPAIPVSPGDPADPLYATDRLEEQIRQAEGSPRPGGPAY